jgi:hypothetical protein
MMMISAVTGLKKKRQATVIENELVSIRILGVRQKEQRKNRQW